MSRRFLRSLLACLLAALLLCGLAIAEEESSPELSVNNAEPLLMDGFQLHVHAPGASLVRIFNGNSELLEEIPRDDNEPDDFYWWTRLEENEACQFFAQSYDEADEMMGATNTVTVTPVCNGEAAPATVEILNETVELGMFLNVRITPNGDVRSYHVRILSAEGDQRLYWWYGTNGGEAKILGLPTNVMDPGEEYRVEVLTEAQGMTFGHTLTDSFTIPENSEKQLGIWVSTNDVYVNDGVDFMVNIPDGMDEFRLVRCDEDGFVIEEYTNGWENANYAQQLQGFGEAGTYKIYAECRQEGGEWLRSETVTVVVSPRSNIELSLDMPSSVAFGDNLTINVPRLDGAALYSLSVTKDCAADGEDDCIFYTDMEEDGGEYTIPAEELEAGRSYRACLSAFVPQSGHKEFNKRFVVTEEAEHELSIFVDNDNPLWAEGFHVTINAPGASFVRLYTGMNGWSDVWPDGRGYENRDVEWAFWDEGANILYARAYYGDMDDGFNPDEVQYTGMSNVVTVNVQTIGSAGIPVVEVVNPVVMKGELLHVKVHTKSGEKWVNTHIVDVYASEKDYQWIGFEATDKDCIDLYLPTAHLEAGHEHIVFATVSDYGRPWTNCNDNNPACHFIVVENTLGTGAQLSINPDTIRIGRSTTVLIAIPGDVEWADLMSVNPDGEEDQGWSHWENVNFEESDGFMEWSCNFDNPEELDFYVNMKLCGEDEVIRTDVKHLRVYALGELATPRIDVPAKLLPTDDEDAILTLRAPQVENAEYVRFSMRDRDGRVFAYVENFAGGEQTDEVEIHLCELELGHVYTIEAFAFADGYISADFSANMVVVGTLSDEHEVTISVDNPWARWGEDFELCVNAPGATFVRVYGSQNGWFDLWPEGNENDYIDRCERWRFEGNPDRQVVYAMACYDELPEEFSPDELNYTVMSNLLEFDFWVNEEDYVAPTDLEVPATVARGELLNVQLHPNGATMFNVYVYRVVDNEGTVDYDNCLFYYADRNFTYGDRTLHVPTANMEPGRYRLGVDSADQGRPWVNSDFYFEVTEGEATDDVVISLSADEILYYSRLRVEVYAPGATNCREVIYDQNGRLWRDSWDNYNREFGYMNVEFFFEEVGEFDVYAYVSYDDCQSWEIVGPERVKVTSNGKLPALELDAPETIYAGDDFTFSFAPVEMDGVHIDWYAYRLSGPYGDCLGHVDAQPGEHTIFADTFAANEVYHLTVMATADNDHVEKTQTDWTIMVLPRETANEDEIWIEVDRNSVPLHDEFCVTIHAPEAAMVRLYTVEGTRDFWDEGYGLGDYQAWMGVSESGFIYARAYNAPLEDGQEPEEQGFGARSNAVYVEVTVDGEGHEPNVTVPKTVKRGELLKVEFELVEGDDRYWMWIMGAEPDNWDDDRYSSNGTGTGKHTVYLPTAHLDEGRKYYINLNSGAYGKTTVQAKIEDCTFLVTGSSDEVVVKMPETVQVRDRYTIYATVPGATNAQLIWYDEKDMYYMEDWDAFNRDQGYVDYSGGFGRSGQYSVYLNVSWDDCENWTAYGPYSITATSLGTLDIPEVNIPAVHPAGEDMVINVGAVEHAGAYVVYMRDDTYGWDGEVGFDYFRAFMNEPGKVTIPGEKFEENHKYIIYVNAYTSEAYSDRDGEEYRVWAYGAVDENVTIAVDNAAPMLDSDITVTIQAPGATFVRLYDNRGNVEDLWLDEEQSYDNLVYIYHIGDEEARSIFARASYDEREEFDPEELNYSGISNAVSIAPYTLGPGTVAEVELEKTTVERGQYFNVTVRTFDNDNKVTLRIRSMNDGSFDQEVYERSYWGDTHEEVAEREMALPSAMLEPGEYRIEVYTRGDGESPVATGYKTGRFTVTPNTQQMYFSVEPIDGWIYRYTKLKLGAPGCDECGFVVYDGDELMWDSTGEAPYQSRAINVYRDTAGTYKIIAHARFGDEWVELEPVYANFASKGALEAPEVTVPDCVLEGERLTINIGEVEHAEDYFVQLWDVRDDECVYTMGYDSLSEAGEFTIPFDGLEYGHVYIVRVLAEAPEAMLDAGETNVDVAVMRMTPDERVTLEADYSELYCYAHHSLRISAPGARRIELHRNGDEEIWRWEDFECDLNGFVWDDTNWWDGVNTYFVYAVYEDEEGNESYAVSRTVTIYTTSYGEAVPANFEISTDEIVRGEMIQVDVTLHEGENRFNASIRSLNEEDYDRNMFDRWFDVYEYDVTQHIYLPTGNLPAGEYRVVIEAYGEGLWGMGTSEEEGHFTVTEGTPEVIFSITPNEVELLEDYRILAYVPNADGIMLTLSHERFGEWDERNEWHEVWEDDQRSSFMDRVESRMEAGVYTIKLNATYDNWETYEEVAQATLTVNCNGYLDPVEIDAPEYVYANEEGVSISFSAVPVADEYHFFVFDQTDGRSIYENWELEPGTVVTIPMSELQPGHTYRTGVVALAWDAGYNGSESARYFRVVDVERDSAISISVETTNPMLGEEIAVLINAPEATFVRLYSLKGRCDDIWPEDFGYENRNIYTSFWDEEDIYIRVSTDPLPEGMENGDELNYGGASNVIHIEPWAQGQAEPAWIEVPETVERGELLNVQIARRGEAERLRLRIISEENEDHETVFEFEGSFDGDNTVTYNLPTGYLTPGEYRVEVESYGGGWYANWTSHEEGRFTVTEGGEDVVFEINPTTFMMTGRYQMSVSAPGSTNGWFRWMDETGDCLWEDWNRWDCERGYMYFEGTWDMAGEYDVYLYVSYDNCESVEEYGPIRVTVECEGYLDQPVVELASPVVACDEELWVRVHAVENAEDYYMTVYGDEGECFMVNFGFEDGETVVDLPIPVGVLEPNRNYTINIWVEAPQQLLASNETNVEIYAIDTINAEKNISVRVTKEDLLLHETIDIIVDAPGAGFVRLYTPDGMEDLWSDPNQGYLGYTHEQNIYCDTLIYAVACYDVPEDWDGNPDALNFTGMSNIIELKPRVIGEGTPADIELNETTVAQGDLLYVTITPYDGNNRFGIGVFNDEGDMCYFGWRNFYEEDVAPFTVTVPTAGFEPGRTYELVVSSSACGYTSVDTVAQFEMTEGEDGIRFTLEPTEVMVEEEMYAVVSAPGANDMFFLWRSENDEGVEGYGWDGESCSSFNQLRQNWAGEYDVYAMLHYGDDEDGEWVASEPIHVSVRSNGKLDMPFADVPAPFVASNDNTIRIVSVDNAEQYDFAIRDEEGRTLFHNIYTEACDVTIPADLLEAGNNYCANVLVTAKNGGYERCDHEVWFTALNASEHIVELSVASTDVLYGETVKFNIFAPGATQVKLGHTENLYEYTTATPDENGNCRIDWEVWYNCYFVMASYVEDPEAEPVWETSSNTVWLTTAFIGEPSLPMVEASDTAVLGKELSVTITPTGENPYYDVHVDEWIDDEVVEGECYYARYVHSGLTPFEISVPTTNMKPDTRYSVKISAGGPGYGWIDSYDNACFFTLTPNENAEFSVLPRTQSVRQPIEIMVYAPEATDAMVSVEGGRDYHYQEDLMLDRESNAGFRIAFWNAFYEGDYAFTVKISADNGETWTTLGSKTVTVTSKGQLAKPVVHVPDVVRPDEAFDVVFEAVEFVQYVSFGIVDMENDWESVFYAEEEFMPNGENHVITVPAGLFTEGKNYGYSCGYYADGYSDSHTGWDGRIYCDSTAADSRVTLELVSTDETLLSCVSYTYRISAPGATYVRVRCMHDPNWYRDDFDLSNPANIVFDEPWEGGRIILYAEAWFGETGDDWDANAAQLVRSDYLVVDIIAYGNATMPEFEVPETVSRGSDLLVSITPSENSSKYRAIIVDEQDNYHWVVDVTNDSREPFTVAMCTNWLEVGRTYFVKIVACGNGYNWEGSEERIPFTVTAINLLTLKLPAALTEVDDEAFAETAMQMVIVPAGVKRIGSRAFANCGDLKFVDIPDSIEFIADDAFEGCSDVIFLCAEEGYAANYANNHGFDIGQR